jgi:hypothetical protein
LACQKHGYESEELAPAASRKHQAGKEQHLRRAAQRSPQSCRRLRESDFGGSGRLEPDFRLGKRKVENGLIALIAPRCPQQMNVISTVTA